MMGLTLLEQAQILAKKAHEGQMYGTHTYTKHLEDVQGILAEFNLKDEALVVAAELHDIIEDTSVTYLDIKELFGEEVAEIVYAVTDERGRTRSEIKAKTYIKIVRNHSAILVKLADRIANTRCSIDTSDKKYKMYQGEFKSFARELYFNRVSYVDIESTEYKMWLLLAQISDHKEWFEDQSRGEF